MIPACLVALLAVFAPVWPQQTPASTPVEQAKRPTASESGPSRRSRHAIRTIPRDGCSSAGLSRSQRRSARARRVPACRESRTRIAEAHNWLGVALAAKSDMPGAVAEFRKAVELDPQYRTRLFEPWLDARSKRRVRRGGEGVQAGARAGAEQRRRASESRHGAPGDGRSRRRARTSPARSRRPTLTTRRCKYGIGQTVGQSGERERRDRGVQSGHSRSIRRCARPITRLATALKQQARESRKAASSTPSAGDKCTSRRRTRSARAISTRARARLEEALRLDEKFADAHTLLGFTLGQQGELPQAITHLQRAIALQPESPDAHYHLGVALWYSGEKDRAVARVAAEREAGSRGGRKSRVSRHDAARARRPAGGARQPAVRDRAAAIERRGLCGSRHRVSACGPARPGNRTVRSRVERAGAGAARAGLERCEESRRFARRCLHLRTNLGIPVPPGFTITTQAWAHYNRAGRQWPEGLWEQTSRTSSDSSGAGLTLGDAQRPLLVSVRSGARVSMPGMMETVLNLGLNDTTVDGLAAWTRNERFAWDCYRRFIMMFGTWCSASGARRSTRSSTRSSRDSASSTDPEVPAAELRKLVDVFKDLVSARTGRPSRRIRASSCAWPSTPCSTRGSPRRRWSIAGSTTSPTSGAPRSP